MGKGKEQNGDTAVLTVPAPSAKALEGVKAVLAQINESRLPPAEETVEPGGSHADEVKLRPAAKAGEKPEEQKPAKGKQDTAPEKGKDAAADEKIPARDEPTPEKAAREKPAISDQLKERAKKFGYTDEMIAAAGPDRLPILLDRMEWTAAAGQPAPLKTEQPPARVDAGATEPAVEVQPTPTGEMPKYLGEIDEDVAEETLTAAVKGIYKEMNQRVAKMEQVFLADRQKQINHNARQFMSRHDKRIKELGPGWQEIFGDKPVGKLQESDPEFEKHTDLWQAMAAISNGMMRENGGQVPDEDEVFRRALNGRFYEHAIALVKDQANREIDEYNEDSLPRPTARKPGATTAAEKQRKAIEKIAAAQAKHRGSG